MADQKAIFEAQVQGAVWALRAAWDVDFMDRVSPEDAARLDALGATKEGTQAFAEVICRLARERPPVGNPG